MSAAIPQIVTFEALERLPDTDEVRYELHHGRLVRRVPRVHGNALIQWKLRKLLESAAGKAGVVVTEFGFRPLPEYEYRIADVAFVERARWDRTQDDGYFEGVPEIIVEVLAASDTAFEMLDREETCLKNGAREFWIVAPVRRLVKVSTAEGRAMLYKPGGRIPLLFGGSLDVDAIFV